MRNYNAVREVLANNPIKDVVNELAFSAAVEHINSEAAKDYMTDEEIERMWETIFRNAKAYRAVRN